MRDELFFLSDEEKNPERELVDIIDTESYGTSRSMVLPWRIEMCPCISYFL
jgi:hypothetical protein